MRVSDPIQIDGVPSSQALRDQLAGQTVILAFSRGKDSLAAWLALRDAGVNVVPYHMFSVPGLRWMTESLAYYAEWFGTPILNLPHPSFFRQLANMVFQPPERCRVIEAANLVTPTYDEVRRLVAEHFGLPADTWVCNGVRAADSPNRRTDLVQHGPVNENTRYQKIIWDWRKRHVMDCIAEAGVKLPPDYEWFGRSFDGIDRRFIEKLGKVAPDDYAQILRWFPLVDMEIKRAAL